MREEEASNFLVVHVVPSNVHLINSSHMKYALRIIDKAAMVADIFIMFSLYDV